MTAGPPPAAEAAPPGPPASAAPPSRYSLGSAKNLVYSLLAVLAMVAVLVAIVPRPDSLGGPPVPIGQKAAQVKAETGWPIVTPQGLPASWVPTSVRYVPVTGGFQTWHVGYRTPSGTFVAVEQTQGANREWIAAQTNRAPRTGTVEVAGRTWEKYVRDTKTQNSLLSVAAGPDELTTLVTGDASFEDIETYIEALRPVP